MEFFGLNWEALMTVVSRLLKYSIWREVFHKFTIIDTVRVCLFRLKWPCLPDVYLSGVTFAGFNDNSTLNDIDFAAIFLSMEYFAIVFSTAFLN